MTRNQLHQTGISEQVGGLEGDHSIDIEKAQQGVRHMLATIGEDPDECAFAETWARRVPEALETLSEAFPEEEKPELRTFNVENGGLIAKTDIPVYSLCEHLFLPFTGTAHVAYRPGDEVVGLSKLTRYIRWQSRRLTVQETLTNEIAAGLADELDAEIVLVDITATHLYEAMRGVETATETRTTATTGEPTTADGHRFRDAIARAESSP